MNAPFLTPCMAESETLKPSTQLNPVIHALADLKANMKASVFFNDAQKMVRNANSWGALARCEYATALRSQP